MNQGTIELDIPWCVGIARSEAERDGVIGTGEASGTKLGSPCSPDSPGWATESSAVRSAGVEVVGCDVVFDENSSVMVLWPAD